MPTNFIRMLNNSGLFTSHIQFQDYTQKQYLQVFLFDSVESITFIKDCKKSIKLNIKQKHI